MPAKNTVTTKISDSVELSEGAQKFSAFLKSAKDAMEKLGHDEEIRAAAIVEQMNAGTYQVSSDDLVNNILGGSPSNS